MNAAASSPELPETLARPLALGPPLRLALLFGSAARGALRPDSDVDVAILPADSELPLAAELDLQAALEQATGRPVHLVRLDRAPLLLRWRIAKEGLVLHAEPYQEAARFLARTAAEYLDFEPALRVAAGLYRRAVLGEGTGA